MSTLSSAKALGGIGAILVLLTFVPSVGAIFGIAGFIMILIAVKYISDVLEDRSVFNNMMTSVILSILGVVVASIIVMATFYSAYVNGYFTSTFAPSPGITAAQWTAFGLTIGLGLLAAWIFFVFAAIYLRRSYNSISYGLEVHMFQTAGLMFLIGAVTAIIGIGFLLILVAQILAAVAFFSIPEKRPERRTIPAAPAPPT